MAEFFQDKKSDPPTFHVGTEYPKHIYGSHPVDSDEDIKTGLANKTIKSRIVHTPAEEETLRKKGWVVNLMDLVKEKDFSPAKSEAEIEDFGTVESVEPVEPGEPGEEPEEEIVTVRRKRKKKTA